MIIDENLHKSIEEPCRKTDKQFRYSTNDLLTSCYKIPNQWEVLEGASKSISLTFCRYQTRPSRMSSYLRVRCSRLEMPRGYVRVACTSYSNFSPILLRWYLFKKIKSLLKRFGRRSVLFDGLLFDGSFKLKLKINSRYFKSFLVFLLFRNTINDFVMF